MSTAVLRRPASSSPEAPRALDEERQRPGWEGRTLSVAAGLVYLGLMAYLMREDLLFTDAVSRVGNAFYALHSRDPHLAAVGFVWNPLPSVMAMPLLLLSPLSPVLVGHLGLAGALPTVLIGVVNAGLVRNTLTRFGAGRWLSLAFAAAYAFHPYIAIGAATGASETLLLCWLLLGTRALVAWVIGQETMQLVIAGLAMALAYLTRYEAVAAAVAVMVGVAIVSAGRHREQRGAYVLNDVVLVGMPFVLAFVGWAVAGKLVVGQWFATFTSEYGNAAQVDFAIESIRASAGGPLGTAGYALTQASALAPALGLVLLVSLGVALRDRSMLLLVPIAAFASVLLFQALVLAQGGSFGWLRFQVSAIPLTVLLAGALAARFQKVVVVPVVMLLAVLVSVPSTLWVLQRPDLAREESIMQLSGRAGQHRMEREIAAWLDAQGLPEGSVITDVAYSGPIVLASHDPRQFVITTDRDFLDALASPRAAGVRYAMVTKPEVSSGDAVARAYPGIYADGGGVGSLAKEWKDGRDYTWRLYELAR